ncbi:hypothetical protein U729_2625 [Clostridium baratii str. Sullivan]|uniref:GmrSD restriction endonucleases N-terminal domain-containing protein n=1 Tax=Clostridium baratii str. Sullivan TaxID=1415775 RepID=A0A0A7FXY3_9CLOT|nr:DUF262 domain-containing protein [Clostridium baratii]AIY83765.1 hypothetical protein U729_2625 [Clostridium baratii str. Sullivan]
MKDNLNTDLDNQVKENRKKFRVDHFDMVISDYVQRIKTGELILDPPYQRLFRWDDETQSQLIESILIGIPLPPIFVFQNDDAKWEVIDGLQRTTTLSNYLSNKEKDEEKIFKGCNIITELNGKTFDELPNNLQRIIKNTRIRIELVEETDDIFSQYLLFNRLNSNGEKLGAQEIRNFLIYKLNNEFYYKLIEISKENEFIECLGLKDERVQKQENVEYALKFFLCREFENIEKLDKYENLNDLITKETEKFLKKYSNDYLAKEFDIFIKTFKLIYSEFGKNSFRYYQKRLNNIANTFSMAIGISKIINSNISSKELKDICKEYFECETYKSIAARGYSPTKRIFELSKFSIKFFKEHME